MYTIVTIEDDMDIVPTDWIVGDEVWLPIKDTGLNLIKCWATEQNQKKTGLQVKQ